ncbi:MAG: 54S ribosomal protein L17 mitochondrial [Geoglossum simile]|nr:MAG: 54S ribosomal protein L17 mitochondrial [Geoglossum simile]
MNAKTIYQHAFEVEDADSEKSAASIWASVNDQLAMWTFQGAGDKDAMPRVRLGDSHLLSRILAQLLPTTKQQLHEMNARQSGARSLALLIGWSTRESMVCKSCLQRQYSLSTAVESTSTTSISHVLPVTQDPPPQTAFRIQAGVVLSRPPQITRDQTPFEKAFFFYQRRLNERLVLPFTRYFYFKQGTPADLEWKRKQAKRLTPARDIGVYNAYDETAWNDELLVGAQEAEPETQVECLLRDAETPGVGSDEMGEPKQETVERPMPRVTEADKRGDEKSLDRKLDRTLYLLVKGSEGRWGFPASVLIGRENLHEAAERILVQAGGVNMNTWVVGHVPIGYHHFDYPKPLVTEGGAKEMGVKTFFMKVRIMAGQADLRKNGLGLVDFKWLAKEEIQKAVSPRYWKHLRGMLAEQ